MDEASLAKLLVSLSSTDLDTQSKAKAEMENAKETNGLWILQALCHIVSHEAPTQIHLAALKELTSIFEDSMIDGNFSTLSPEEQENVKSSLVSALTLQTGKGEIMHALCECVEACALTVYSGDDGEWFSLFDYLLNVISEATTSNGHACGLLEALVEMVGPYFETYLAKFSSCIQNCLERDVKNSEEMKLKTNAWTVFVSLLGTIDSERMPTLLPVVKKAMKVVEVAIEAKDNASAREMLGGFCDLISDYPEVVAHFDELLTFFLGIAIAPQCDGTIKQSACEVLIAGCHLPQATKVKNFSTTLLDNLFALSHIIRIDDPVAWDKIQFSDVSLIGGAGLDIDSVSNAFESLLSEKQLAKFAAHAQTIVSENIKSDSWEFRFAAVSILTYCLAPLRDHFSAMLEPLVNMLVPLVTDENKFVRFAALQCVNQLACCLQPDLQLGYHKQLMDALLAALKDPSSQRVRGAAALATLSLFAAGNDNRDCHDEDDDDRDEETDESDDINSENSKQEENNKIGPENVAAVLKPYGPDASIALLDILGLDPIAFTAPVCFGALIEVISVIQLDFVTMVPRLMGIFDTIVRIWQNVKKKTNDEATETPEDDTKEPHVLATLLASLDCVTRMATRITVDNFRPYINSVCEPLFELFNHEMPAGLQLSMITSAINRLVACVGLEIYHYLPELVPRSVKLVKGEELEDAFEEEGLDDEAFYPHVFRVNLLTIIKSLVELKGDLGPIYRPLIAEAAQDLLTNEEPHIRHLAASILGDMVASFKFAPASEVTTFVVKTITALADALKSVSRKVETEYQCIAAYLLAIYQIGMAFGESLPDTQLLSLTSTFVQLCKEAVRIQKSIIESRKARSNVSRRKSNKKNNKNSHSENDEDNEDEDDDPNLEEGLEDMVANVSYAIEPYLRFSPHFTPFYQHNILRMVLNTLLAAPHEEFISMGLDYLSDYMEHSHNKAALSDIPLIAPKIFNFANHFHPAIAQSVFNALRKMLILLTVAKAPQEQSSDYANQVLTKSVACLKRPASRSEAFAAALTNAVSAGLYAVEKYSHALSAQLINEFKTSVLPLLPLGDADEEEAQSVHKRLLEMLKCPPLNADSNLRSNIVGKLKNALPNTIDPETAEELATL